MPAKSGKQRRLFCEALEDDELLDELGVSREVAKEFCRDDVESIERDIDKDEKKSEGEDD